MIIREVCSKCGATVGYENKSRWEGNRDFENIECPVCKNVIRRVFTDLTPTVWLVKKGTGENQH